MTASTPEKPIPISPEVKTARAKKLTGTKALLLLFLLTISVGITVLIYGHQTRFCHDLDLKSVTLGSFTDNSLCDLDPASKTITIRSLTTQPDRGLNFKLIAVSNDPDQVFENSPPSPLDYAVLLHHLQEAGAKNIVLTTRMSWDGDLGITSAALSDKLSTFHRANIGLPLTRGSHKQELPDILRQSIIPFSNVSGNYRILPIVNQVTVPSAVKDSDQVRAGFSHIESAPEEASTIPLICVWEGEGITPSLELLALMNAHDIDPDQVIIHCNEHIRLGLDGPVIPLGSYGEIHLPVAAPELSATPSLNAEQLIFSPDEQDSSFINDEDPTIYLVHAVGEKTASTNLLTTDRIRAIIHWSKKLPVPDLDSVAQHPRLPLWAHGVIFFDIALAAWVFAGWTRARRHLSFLLTAIISFPLLLVFMELTEHWMSTSSFFAALLIAWLLPIKRQRRKRKVHPLHNTDSITERSA